MERQEKLLFSKHSHEPTVFDNYQATMMYKESIYSLNLWVQSVNKKSEIIKGISDAMNDRLKEEMWISSIKLQKYLLDCWNSTLDMKEEMIIKIKESLR